MALILDTGPLLAFFDQADEAHQAARRLFRDTREPLVIPAPVLVELDYWIHERLRPEHLSLLMLDIVRGIYRVEALEFQDYVRVSELVDEYARMDIGFVDAAVLAIVERLGEPKLATLDRRHFGVMKPRHVLSLQLLPELSS